MDLVRHRPENHDINTLKELGATAKPETFGVANFVSELLKTRTRPCRVLQQHLPARRRQKHRRVLVQKQQHDGVYTLP